MDYTKIQFGVLFEYHWHVRARLLDAASRLDEAAYRASPGYGHGSIHDLLFHVLRAERDWRVGLETGFQPEPFAPEAYPDLAAIRAGMADEAAAWASLTDGLSGAEIEAELILTARLGRAWPIPRWRVLQHQILHGMQHHAELARLLTEAGQSPGDLDFIFFRPASS